MNDIIIYKGKYGATRQYAQWLASSLKTQAYEETAADNALLNNADRIIVGTSIYIGKLMISNWLFKNKTLLAGKKIILFIVCGTPLLDEKAIELLIRKNIPPELKGNLTLHFLRGRIIRKQLSFKDKWLLILGAAATKDPAVKKSMLSDFDDVRPENLAPLIASLHSS